MISDAAIADLKARQPCDQVAARWVALRRHGRKLIGPCPLHSPDPAARDSTAFECDAAGWVCATCADGGDVIKLVMKREGIDFPRAVELLGGAAEPSAERAAELAREQARRREKSEREASIYREQERRTAFDIWHRGADIGGSPAEKYLAARGIAALPARVPLRFAPEVAYFHGEEINERGRKVPRLIYRGPAMLAAIVDAAGKFRAVHITWIDVERPGKKAAIADPAGGEPLPAKKVRGSKTGNLIRLAPALPRQERRWIVGEGIETVLSVWYAYAARPRSDDGFAWRCETAFYGAVDLGNLAGKATASVPHPTLKDAGGRTRRVPGPAPEPTSPSIAVSVPDAVVDVILLGDGDSDRFTTRCALARASARFALTRDGMTHSGRTVRCAWAPEGMDFNDLLRAA